jgi:hypothetical protein
MVPPDWYRVQSFDFQFSGFDRGHMVPNADRDNENSIPINQATYLMSNMVAQAPDNNQGPWANFENYLRTLVGTRATPTNEIYIVSGPAGTGGSGSNGGTTTTLADGHVTVPALTWKVALVLPYGNDDVSRVSCAARTIAVVMPNVQGIFNTPWETFLTTVDDVEALTGYDLFSAVPQTFQNCIEAGLNGVNPKSQVITFPPIDGHRYGDADFTVAATATSGLPVAFTVVSGPATIVGNLVHLTGAGTVTIRATQGGNVATSSDPMSERFAAAAPVEQTFVVDKALPAFSALPAQTIEAGTASVSVAGTIGSNGLVPPGSVSVTLGAAALVAPIGAGGGFSATFSTGSLAPGTYPITLQYAGDANFESATGASTLIVSDTTGPSIGAMSATPDVLGPPDHKMIDVFVGYSASDITSPPVCALSVSSSEPVNATGDGTTAIDWIVLDAHHVQLRAERSGRNAGRIYTITATCTDSAGNSSSTSTTVSVPK